MQIVVLYTDAARAELSLSAAEDSVIHWIGTDSEFDAYPEADAYLDLFMDKTAQVPWGTPCARLEGGVYTGRGEPTDSCNVGVPENVPMVEREYVIDEAKGAVSVFLKMGENKLPDSHTFRVENGRIRYVHTVTNCGEQDNCGFPPFEEMLKDNPGMQPDLGG